jgi:hypothetical protein
MASDCCRQKCWPDSKVIVIDGFPLNGLPANGNTILLAKRLAVRCRCKSSGRCIHRYSHGHAARLVGFEVFDHAAVATQIESLSPGPPPTG